MAEKTVARQKRIETMVDNVEAAYMGATGAAARRVDVAGAELRTDARTGKQYAAYVCRIQPASTAAAPRHALRRYSDWQRLRGALPLVPAASLPAFPPKQLFGSMDPRVLESRRLALHAWMEAVMQIPSLREADALHEWLRPVQEDLDYDREYGRGRAPQPEPQPDRAPEREPPSDTWWPPGQPPQPLLPEQEEATATTVPAAVTTEKKKTRLKTAGVLGQSLARLRTESALSEAEASVVTAACSGRYEYVITFAPGADGRRIATATQKLLAENELHVERISSTAEREESESQCSLLVTTSAAQFDLQAERDAAHKWTKQNDAITGKPRQMLFTRARCAEFAGEYRNGELLHEHGSPDFFSAAERARMIHSIIDDLRAKDDVCSALVADVAKLDGCAHIISPKLERESLINALARCAKRLFGAVFFTKNEAIILPRQARDKHSENSKKKALCAGLVS
jgi:hypothetical protein